MTLIEYIYPDLECSFCRPVNQRLLSNHQHTMYEDKESNYVSACPYCKEINDEYWNEMWADYYGNCM